jgi:hypothetical protein
MHFVIIFFGQTRQRDEIIKLGGDCAIHLVEPHMKYTSKRRD